MHVSLIYLNHLFRCKWDSWKCFPFLENYLCTLLIHTLNKHYTQDLIFLNTFTTNIEFFIKKFMPILQIDQQTFLLNFSPNRWKCALAMTSTMCTNHDSSFWMLGAKVNEKPISDATEENKNNKHNIGLRPKI